MTIVFIHAIDVKCGSPSENSVFSQSIVSGLTSNFNRRN